MAAPVKTVIPQLLDTLTSDTTFTVNKPDSAFSFRVQPQVIADATGVTKEISDRAAADVALQSALTDGLHAEASARSSADAALGARVTTESNARFAADNILSSNLNTETSERMAEDANLQAQINALPAPVANPVHAVTGTGTSDGAGNVSVTFTAFAHYAVSFVVNPGTPAARTRFTLEGITASSATGVMEFFNTGTSSWLPQAAQPFTWYAGGY